MTTTRLLCVLLFLCLRAEVAGAQEPRDSAPLAASSPDRYVIDAAKVVREGGARSVADLLIGQVPGLLVVPGSGLTGAGSRIRFAGPRSLVDDAAPLFLVDGVRVDAAEDASLLSLGGAGPLRLEDLSPEDIESIEIVRSPASGAAYGPGAANGVILIHTKTGRSGPMRWETHAHGGLEVVPSRWPTNYGGVDADNPDPRMRTGGCTLTQQAAGNCVQDSVQAFNPLAQRSPFATVLRRQVGFSGTGGPRWGAFRLAGAFDGDDGAYAVPSRVPEDAYRIWNLRGSGTLRPLRALEIGVTFSRVSGTLGLPTYQPVQAALRGPSDSTGFAWDSLFGFPATQTIDRMSGTVEVRGTPRSWLAIHGLMGLDDVDQHDEVLRADQVQFAGRRQFQHRTSMVALSINGPTRPGLRFETNVGVERFGSRADNFLRWGTCGVQPCSIQTTRTERHSLGAFIAERAVVRDRLFITGSVRHDRFEEYRVGATHPSLAVAWVARDGRPGLVRRLQVRGAYGSAGTTPPDALTSWGPSPGLVPEFPPLRPDRTRSLELGADAALLSGRWNARVTFYDTHSDAIYQAPRPPSLGGSAYASGAEISNRGVEATLAGALLDRPTVRWDVRLSIWGNRNRLVTLNGPPVAGSPQSLVPGYPVGGYWAFAIQSFADANGDGIIVPSEIVIGPNAVWAGTPYPTQGVALASHWRLGSSWHLSAGLEYRAGQTLFNQTARSRCGRTYAMCRARNDPQTPLAEQAIAVAALSVNPTAYFEDADYLKLREVALTLDLPTGAAAALGSRAATITLAGRNLATWTGYSGPDPEAGSYGVSLLGQQTVQDFGTVPPLRSMTLRVQLAY